MPDLNLTKLREIALAATPGDWTADIHKTRRRSPRTRRWLQWKPEHGTHGYVSVVESDGAYGVLDGPDALHVATFDPPTVLALIDELEQLRRWKREAKQVLKGLGNLAKVADAPLGHPIIESAIDEIERLRGVIERVRELAEDSEPQCCGPERPDAGCASDWRFIRQIRKAFGDSDE